MVALEIHRVPDEPQPPGRTVPRRSAPHGLHRARPRSGEGRRVRCYHGALFPSRSALIVIVKQIWTGNNYRNFNYLVACAETGEPLAIDPLDAEKCFAAAKEAGW